MDELVLWIIKIIFAVGTIGMFFLLGVIRNEG
ncbi:hypothetical protein HNP81_002339 [Peribacillus huizhouensis]|uniref:Uncharacterized protein n=1 Tax=Peribacillus huizhouensis TaxID=1501239 RepID=A0ABR6CPV4_9BACI|nr:hypothetical protein [Peribacillus huizhouensis]